MTREEWAAYAESVRATPNQRGRIQAEFDRLDVDSRAERLAVLAALLDLDELESTATLTLGQAGRAVNALQHTASRAELPEITPAPVDDAEHGGDNQTRPERITWPEVIGRIVTLMYAAISGVRAEGRSNSAD